VAAKKLLIAGALGVVGRAAVRHFDRRDGWSVVGLSRRAPDFETTAKFLSVDLQNKEECKRVLGAQTDVTHMLYAALHEQPSLVAGWTEADHVRTNLTMLSNLLDAIEPASSGLEHVTLMQGGKAYGVHLGPPPHVPSRESDGRTMPPNFYFDQEDFIISRQKGKPWTWTALRPPSVCGFTTGSPMNMILALGVFAAITRELGLPLRFSGALGHLKDTCDSGLLARATEWAGQAPAARNQVFNVANGDCFLWENIFPKVAEVFRMLHGNPHSLSLARTMPGKARVWDDIVQKHQLKPYRLSDLVPSWDFADFTFRYRQAPYHSLLSTVKIRQAGFNDCADTESMFVSHLRQLQRDRILPR
jgi:nucleoside-diphosphate-sugar epimerase